MPAMEKVTRMYLKVVSISFKNSISMLKLPKGKRLFSLSTSTAVTKMGSNENENLWRQST